MSKKLAYILFAVFAFLVFLALQFPYDLLTPKIIDMIERQLSRDRSVHLRASSISPYFPPGITLHDVVVTQNNQTVLEAKSLSARLQVLPLLSKRNVISFTARAYGGNISGQIGQRGAESSGNMQLKDMGLKTLVAGPPLSLPLDGKISGNLSFRWVAGKPQETQVNGKILLANGKFGPGNIGGFELPSALRLDDQGKPAELTISTTQGQFKPLLKIKNDDLSLDLKGSLSPGPNFNFWSLDLDLTFGVSDAVKGQLPSSLFTMFLAQGQNADGTYSYRLKGPPARLQFLPARGGGFSGGMIR